MTQVKILEVGLWVQYDVDIHGDWGYRKQNKVMQTEV